MHLTCDGPRGTCNQAVLNELDRLTIVDSHGMTGTWVTLSTSQGFVLDSFFAVQVGPESNNQITGASRSDMKPSRFSYIEFSIDPATGKLEGTLVDPESVNSFHITGWPLHRLADIFHGKPPSDVDPESLTGTYKGWLAGLRGKLVVKFTPDKRFVGFFASDSKSDGITDLTLKFDGGAWDSGLALLQLTITDLHFFAEGELSMVLAPSRVSFHAIYVNGFASEVTTFTKINFE